MTAIGSGANRSPKSDHVGKPRSGRALAFADQHAPLVGRQTARIERVVKRPRSPTTVFAPGALVRRTSGINGIRASRQVRARACSGDIPIVPMRTSLRVGRYRVRPVGSAPVSIGVACTSPPTLDPPASLSGRAARSIGAHTTSDLVAADASARPRGRASDDERPVRPMLGHIRPVA
jgi:hypothetical protein